MEKIEVNTAYQLKIYSDQGGVCFKATRRYNTATWKDHTEYGFLGWVVETHKIVSGRWQKVRFNEYPERIGRKKQVVEFLKERPIFSEAYKQLTTKQ